MGQYVKAQHVIRDPALYGIRVYIRGSRNRDRKTQTDREAYREDLQFLYKTSVHVNNHPSFWFVHSCHGRGVIYYNGKNDWGERHGEDETNGNDLAEGDFTNNGTSENVTTPCPELLNVTNISIVPNGDMMVCGYAIGNIYE